MSKKRKHHEPLAKDAFKRKKIGRGYLPQDLLDKRKGKQDE